MQNTAQALATVVADLNGAAEAIWLATQSFCPALSLEVLPQCASTNTVLMDRGRQGDTQTTLVAAAEQTAGRGRRGRQWLAHPGQTLTFSLGIALNLDQVPGGGSALSLAVGLAVADALDAGMSAFTSAAGLAPHRPMGLKWPNDLWIGGRKLGGILIEACPAPGLPSSQRWVVIGIGLNVQGTPSAPEATSLIRPDQAALTIGQVWQWVAPTLIRRVHAFERHGFAPLQEAYARRDVLLGQQIGLWSTPGQSPGDGYPPNQIGLAQGVDTFGALVVHTDQGQQTWSSGDVSVRPRPN